MAGKGKEGEKPTTKQKPESKSEPDREQLSRQGSQENASRKKAPKLTPKQPSQQAPAKKQADAKRDGEDLTTILDESQRTDLTLLVASTTGSMRQLVEDTFDASAGLNKALLSRDDMTEDEKLMSADIDPGTADVAVLDRERKLKEQFEKELAKLEVKELKKSALKAFDGWRETVMERLGQVVNSKRTAQGQVEKDAKARKTLPQAPDQTRLDSVVDRRSHQEQKLKFKDLYPPAKTPLTKMSMQQRTLVLHSLLLLLLSLEHYNARSRVLLLHLTSSLKLPLRTFEQDESTVAKGLLEAAREMNASEETKKTSRGQ